MDQTQDFSDPSDWNNTSLSGLYPLDSNLRCLICKDFYTAPVITTCLHTFCSLCIRRSLSAEAQCPACRTKDITDNGLRANKVVEDLVENYLAVRYVPEFQARLTCRPRLLELARNQSATTPLQPLPPTTNDAPITALETVVIPDTPPRIPSPPKIQCPICSRPFKSVEQVDAHIDNCTGPQPQPHPRSHPNQSYNLRPSKAPPQPPTDHSSLPPNGQRRVLTPLPKVNYAMYNETKLRQLLSELGLPTYGNKVLLSARHKEYVNLHNANIDRRDPQSQRELLRQLERWDATQQALMRGEKRKEVDGKEWAAKWGDDFADLARRARESTKRRKTEEAQNEKLTVAFEEVKSSQEGTVADCIL